MAACTQKVDSSLTFSPENFPDLSFSINDGAQYTNSENISIKIRTNHPDVEKVYIAKNEFCTDGQWFEFSDNLIADLNMIEGPTYFSVKLKTRYGFDSQCITQSIFRDTTGPKLTASSLSLEKTFTNSISISPVISWLPAEDSGSGVGYYEYAIGTFAGGVNTLSWTPIDDITSVKNSSLYLANNGKYYPSIRAVDKLGNRGEAIHGPFWTVDLDAPQTTLVTGPTNGTYNGGENLNFTIKMNEPVIVTGVPKISLSIGANSKYADFFSGSGTDSLTFRYVTKIEDGDSDGIAMGSTIELNAGTIQDRASNDANLSFAALNLSGVKITGCPPNYVLVPRLLPYTTKDFCVAKYEMKITGQANGDRTYSSSFVAESRASGTPWVSINHTMSINECQALGIGYDLISNAQ